MRPLIFDFSQDKEALKQQNEYMFGNSLLINPITQSNVQSWKTYLPEHAAGWIDFWNGNKEALIKEFGTQETYEWFYGGKDRNALIRNFTTDLERAKALDVRYVVFHVSNRLL